jgi:hypothetical protein
VIEVNNACIEELASLEEHESLKFLGFNMTYSNVNNSILALISITATAYEILKT